MEQVLCSLSRAIQEEGILKLIVFLMIPNVMEKRINKIILPPKEIKNCQIN